MFTEKSVAIVKEPLYYYFYRENSTVNKEWTPEQLNQVNAWIDQIEFLKKYQYEDVYKAAIRRFIFILTDQLERINVCTTITDAEKRKYNNRLKTALSKTLKENRSFLNEDDRYYWYYNIAHPVLSWGYWKMKWISGKLRRLFS